MCTLEQQDNVHEGNFVQWEVWIIGKKKSEGFITGQCPDKVPIITNFFKIISFIECQMPRRILFIRHLTSGVEEILLFIMP